MKIAVTSVSIFDVPDDSALETVRKNFDVANRMFVGMAMRTLSGQAYVLRAIEKLEVTLRDS